MNESQKQKLEGSGGAPPKRKMRLVKGTKFFSILFIAASILISAGIMKAANSVYYDLDTATIMTTETQIMSGNLTINNNSTTMTTNIGTGTTSGDVTIGGGSNDVIIATNTWDVSVAGVMSGMILNPAAGTAAAGTAPLKFTSGVLNTTAEIGAMEFNSTGTGTLYFSPAAATRRQVGLMTAPTDEYLCTYEIDTGTIDCTTDPTLVGHAEVTIAAFSETGDAEGLNLAVQALTMHGATVTTPGGVSISAQEFNGLKTFDDGVTSQALITGEAGLTASGAAINLNASSNFATNIGTGTTNALVAIGGGSNAGTWDATSLSFDATVNSNLSVAGSAQTLTLAATGGSTNQVIVNSAGTGADAVDINATGTGGGMTVNTTDGAIALTAGGAANGDINLVVGDDFSLTGVAGSVFGIATGNVAQTVNIGTGTDIDTINIGTGGTGVDAIQIGSANSNLALTDGQWSITAAGAATFISMDAGSGAVSGGAGTLASLAVGGGYGSSGSTFDATGNIQANGALTLGTASSVSGDITLYNAGSAFWQKIATSAAGSNQTYTLRTTGGTIAMTDDVTSFGATGVLRGQVNIFGFDYPAQCSTSCVSGAYKIFSRTIDTWPNFPAVLGSKTRKYALVIRYADTAASGTVNFQVYDSTGVAIIKTFTPAFGASDIEQGKVYFSTLMTTAELANLITGNNWYVEAGLSAGAGTLRIFSIELAAYDVD